MRKLPNKSLDRSAVSNDEGGTMNDESRVPRSAFIIHTCFSAGPGQL
jgi:hypothetical protein